MPAQSRTARVEDPTVTYESLAVAWLSTYHSVNTRSAYGSDLARFDTWCSDKGVALLASTTEDMSRYLTACRDEGTSSRSMARRLSSIRSFLRYAANHGAPGAADCYDDLERPPLPTSSPTVTLDDEEADALLHAADHQGAKSAFLLRLLMLDGLKVGEAIRSDANDIGGRAPRLTLTVTRGDQRSVVALHQDTARAATAYLARRRSGPLLLGDSPTRKKETRLTRFGVDYIIKSVAALASIDASVSANSLRRRFVNVSHSHGFPVSEIQRMVGHVDERTTRRLLGPESDASARSR